MAYGNKMYRLDGGASATAAAGDGALTFTYKEYDAQKTIDGVIRYVDVANSKTLGFYTTISGLANGEKRDVELPKTITEDGLVYRPLSFDAKVTAENPGNTTFSVPVFALGQAEASQAYMATVKMVAGDETIAGDAVWVKSKASVTYTAPSTIYKTRDGQVHTYQLKSSPTRTFGMGDARPEGDVVKFEYELQASDDPEVTVTFKQVNSQERAGSSTRVLGTQTATVSADNKTATPKAEITVNGTTYKLAGSASAYAYTYGSGEAPVVNAYYVPEGYEAPGAYDVTVNYVDYSTRTVIDSETFEASPDSTADATFTAPESFSKDGVDWVRLDGQDEGIAHNYYSYDPTSGGKAPVYTVYYRDSSKKLEQAPVISRVRTVYRDGGTTTTTTTTRPAGGASGSSASASAGAADGSTASTQASLRDDSTYDVADGGDSSQTATAQDGREASQERIEDDETAMASGVEDAESAAPAQAAEAGLPGWLVPLAVAVLAVAAVIVAIVVKRRRENEYLA